MENLNTGDVTTLAQAKSDQMNAADITGSSITVMIKKVVQTGKSDQPLDVYISDRPLPWRPSKGMIRMLIGCFTKHSINWVGQMIELYEDPTVTWAGKAAGGIRFSAASHGDSKPKTFRIPTSRSKKVSLSVANIETMAYPGDKFQANKGIFMDAMQQGKTDLDGVVLRVINDGVLTIEQRLELLGGNQIEPVQDYTPEPQEAKQGFTPAPKQDKVQHEESAKQAPSDEDVSNNF